MELDIDALRYRQGSFLLDLSLHLPAASFGVILGPSGCGKSTLLRLIAGLARADSGTIRLGGRDLAGVTPESRNLGFVFQDYSLFPQMSAADNVAFGLRVRKVPKAVRSARVRELASRLKITELLERRPGDLSGGEKQRVALARALAIEPDLVLMDEPLSALDGELRRELRSFIRESVRDAGRTTLFVTHDVEEALYLADRLFLLRDGRIASQGAPEDLLSHPPDSGFVRFFGLGLILAVTQRLSADSWLTAAGMLRCPPSLKDPAFLHIPAARIRWGLPPGSGDAWNRFSARIDSLYACPGGIRLDATLVGNPHGVPPSIEEVWSFSLTLDTVPSLAVGKIVDFCVPADFCLSLPS